MVTCNAEVSKRISVGPDDVQMDLPRDITHVALQPEVQEIHNNAFFSCQDLVQVEIPLATKLRIIRSKAFYNCRVLNDISIPPTVKQIHSHVFFWCESLTSMSLAKTQLDSVAAYAFAYCLSLKEVLLPSTIKLIETCAFLDCKQLVRLEFPEGLNIIMDNAFKMCHSLETAHIPSTVTKIGPRAFANCSKIHTVEISLEASSLYEIGSAAFRGCYELENIAVPKDTLVQNDAFRLCPKLAENLAGDLPPDYDEAMTVFLQRRFEDLPLHQLCYSISYCSESEVNIKIENLLRSTDDTSWYKRYDPLRKTPSHLLALASNCSPQSNFCSDLVAIIFSKPIQALGLECWRATILAMLGEYNSAPTRQERVFQIDQILSKLESFGLMEATSLLEQALWKSTMKSKIHYNGAREYPKASELRRQCFLQCGSHTVINSVLPFLRQTRAPMVPFFDDESMSNETAISW